MRNLRENRHASIRDLRDAYLHNGTPIFTANVASGCPNSRKYGHGGAHIYVKIGIRDAHIWGCLFSLDTGTVWVQL